MYTSICNSMGVSGWKLEFDRKDFFYFVNIFYNEHHYSVCMREPLNTRYVTDTRIRISH